MKHQYPQMKHKYHLAIHYVLLVGIFLTGGLALVLLTDKTTKLIILISLTLVYLIWGIWHHYEHNTLTKDVILEYIGVAGIITLVFMLVA